MSRGLGFGWVPGRGLAWLLGVWLAAGVAAVIWPQLTTLWLSMGLAIASLLGAAVWRLRRFPELTLRREVSSTLPLGEWSDVQLHIESPQSRPLRIEVFDHVPSHANLEGLPFDARIPAESSFLQTYRLRPRRRGDMPFAGTEIWHRGPFDLLRRRQMISCPSPCRVLPNFRPILIRGLAGLETRLAGLGMHLQRRRGEGLEFQELRDYLHGDSIRRIDWKATARRNRLITRQYQDERNQQVVLLLDCGRRMHAEDGDLSHFDHVLNASLLLAYVALKQGDAVGAMAFAGADRWLPPVRGTSALHRLLDSIHDLQTTLEPPDFQAAAAQLMSRQRRRALVLIVTNLRDEDTAELLPAIRMLRRQHLVLVASTREQALGQLRDQEIHDFTAALEVSAAHNYIHARQQAHKVVRGAGAFLLDVEPQQLPYALVGRYLDIKRAGQL